MSSSASASKKQKNDNKQPTLDSFFARKVGFKQKSLSNSVIMPPMLPKAQAAGNQMSVPNAPEGHTSKKRNFDNAIGPIDTESKEEEDSTGTKNLQEDSDSNKEHSTIAQREEEKTTIQEPDDDSTDVCADVSEKERDEESGPQPAPAKKRKLVHANTLADLAAVKRKGPALLLRKGTAASTPPKNQIKTVGITLVPFSLVIICSDVCQPLLFVFVCYSL